MDATTLRQHVDDLDQDQHSIFSQSCISILNGLCYKAQACARRCRLSSAVSVDYGACTVFKWYVIAQVSEAMSIGRRLQIAVFTLGQWSPVVTGLNISALLGNGVYSRGSSLFLICAEAVGHWKILCDMLCNTHRIMCVSLLTRRNGSVKYARVKCGQCSRMALSTGGSRHGRIGWQPHATDHERDDNARHYAKQHQTQIMDK
jgi:hypothetical protein